MPNHHPPASTGPTAKQQRYLRALAERTGPSFTPPKIKAEASREIERLQSRTRDRRSDQACGRKQVIADLQAGAGTPSATRPRKPPGTALGARWAR